MPKVSQVPRDRALALGAGYGILALIFVIGGSFRNEASHKALDAGSFARLPSRIVLAITSYTVVLIILTVVALF